MGAQALRAARRDEPRYETERKLAVLREAASYNYATADIDEILADTERGRLEETL